MAQDWRLEFNRLAVLLLAAVVLGFLFDNLLLFLFLTLLIYILYCLNQLRKLNRWLQNLTVNHDTAPPESTGFWGVLFDAIYQLQRGERKANMELQQILDRGQKSVGALDIGVILIDRANCLEWWNQAAETLLGIRFPDDRSQSATNLIRDPRFGSYFTREDYDEPLVISSPVNYTKMLEFKITLFGEHERLIIVRDITQLYKLELMRKDFVGNVSHELRTPITVISGYLETLLDNNRVLDAKWHKALEQMYQQSQRVENILRDLLILSRLETEAISLQQATFNVRALLGEIRNDTLNIADDMNHTINIECDDTLTLTADRSELYSAISNLAFNAAKYTPRNGNIILRGELTDTKLEISVIDDGIGIEMQHIPRLTERFYRIDRSRSSSTGGTGLGLAIVKHILARHSATLHISSELGKGSSFTCRFPQQKSQAQNSQPGS